MLHHPHIYLYWVGVLYHEYRVLMIWLMSFTAIEMVLLVDVTNFVSTETDTYNEGMKLAMELLRYIVRYLLVSARCRRSAAWWGRC